MVRFLMVVVLLTPAMKLGAEEPESPNTHLKPLDALVGTWKLSGQIGGDPVTSGSEKIEWIFEKTALKGVGWWQGEEGKFDYEYVVTWNSRTNEIVTQFVIANGGSATRRGHVDAEKRVWTSWHHGAAGDGETFAGLVTVEIAEDGKSFDWKLTSGSHNGQPWPDGKLTFTRVE